MILRQMNVVAIEFCDLLEGSTASGALFLDRCQQVLGKRLTNLPSRMSPAQFADQFAKIMRRVRHLFNRGIAAEFVSDLCSPRPARVNDKDRFWLHLHPAGDRVGILSHRRTIMRLYRDHVILFVGEGFGPDCRGFHTRLVGIRENMRQVNTAVDVPLHVTRKSLGDRVPR